MMSSSRTTNKVGTAMGKGCGILFCSVFAAFGVFFAWMVGKSVVADFNTRSWVATEAQLLGRPTGLDKLERDFKDGDHPEEQVPYRYTYEGKAYSGNRVTLSGSMRVNGSTSDTGHRLANLPAGTKVTCFVNPANPSEAVLEQRSLGYAWFMLLPGVFLLFGLGGIFAILFVKSGSSKAASERHRPVGSRGASGVIGLRIFGSIFAIVGGAAGWFLVVKPVMLSREASSSWSRVPCRVESAKVVSHRGSKGGSTYNIEVVYFYEFQGQRYSGDRYSFNMGSSSSRAWRDEAVSALRADKNPVCFVNPADPVQSVISTDLGSDIWFGLIPLVFLVVGLGIFFGAPKMAVKNGTPSGIPQRLPANDSVPLPQGGFELKPAITPKAGCVGMGCVSLFWNGIVWTIFLQSDTPTVVRLFLLIFVAIGLAIFGGFGYYFLAMFNPKPTVIVSAREVPLGGAFTFQWRFTGNVGRITKLTVTLMAKESATYRRGTSSTTDHHYFIVQQVTETRDRSLIGSGEVTITIPVDSMHTFDAPNNKIQWAVKLSGDIAKWPDVDLEFPITVLPLNASQTPIV